MTPTFTNTARKSYGTRRTVNDGQPITHDEEAPTWFAEYTKAMDARIQSLHDRLDAVCKEHEREQGTDARGSEATPFFSTGDGHRPIRSLADLNRRNAAINQRRA